MDSRFVSTTFTAYPTGLGDLQVNGDKLLELAKGRFDEISFPVSFTHSEGKILRDILDTGSVTLYLISEKMRGLLEANHFTGWKTFPIELLDKKGNSIEGYWGFSITGKCGNIDYSKCEVVQRPLYPSGPLKDNYKGLEIGLGEWDGSDIFCPFDTFHKIVSKDVAEVIMKNKLSNIKLENLSTVEIPVICA